MNTPLRIFVLLSVLFCSAAVAQTNPDGSLKPLVGQWIGQLKPVEAVSLTIVFRFEAGKDGTIAGFLDVPDQGAKGLPVTEIKLADGQANFKVAVGTIEYAGKLSGNRISGVWKQNAQEWKLELVKGTYEPPATAVTIPAETMKKLLGRWTGKVGPLTVVWRFERNASGKYAVFLDSPDQGAKDIPVSKAAMIDGRLVLTVASVSGEYIGSLSGNEINGVWTQGGMPTPLNLTRGK